MTAYFIDKSGNAYDSDIIFIYLSNPFQDNFSPVKYNITQNVFCYNFKSWAQWQKHGDKKKCKLHQNIIYRISYGT